VDHKLGVFWLDTKTLKVTFITNQFGAENFHGLEVLSRLAPVASAQRASRCLWDIQRAGGGAHLAGGETQIFRRGVETTMPKLVRRSVPASSRWTANV
jgi:hypothetical protein